MENKEKQIEEMAKDYYGYSIDLEDDCKFVAEEMFERGHRKITDDQVVISKKEYEKNIRYYNSLENMSEKLNNLNLELGLENQKLKVELENKSKETVEKAFKIIKNVIDKKYAIETPWTRATLSNIINQIEKEFAKQFDVEIKE